MIYDRNYMLFNI